MTKAPMAVAYEPVVPSAAMSSAAPGVDHAKDSGMRNRHDSAIASTACPRHSASSPEAASAGVAPTAMRPAMTSANELAKPVPPCDQGARGAIQLGGRTYCLPTDDTPEPASCTGLKVGYDLVGLTETQVAIRAVPTVAARKSDGSPAEETVIEAFAPVGAGEVTLGCLSPGIAYEIAVDVIGDPLGPLTKRLVTVPGT